MESKNIAVVFLRDAEDVSAQWTLLNARIYLA